MEISIIDSIGKIKKEDWDYFLQRGVLSVSGAAFPRDSALAGLGKFEDAGSALIERKTHLIHQFVVANALGVFQVQLADFG